MKEKKILVVGANFTNKGAQSMLFVTMDELRKRNSDCVIYFLSNDSGDFSNYRFIRIPYSLEAKSIALGRHCIRSLLIKTIKDILYFAIRHRNGFGHYFDIKRLMTSIDCIVDISGFNFGKKWSPDIQERNLDNIRLAKKYSVPIYLLPQSFGPFDYPSELKYILKDMNELLRYPTKIFAREKEGYQMLLDTFHLSNVTLSTDLVLQNCGVNPQNIFKKPVVYSLPEVEKNAVGIVPNMQCFRFGNKEVVFEIYREIINELVNQGKKVYIFRHSKDDLDICKEIYSRVGQNHILLLDNDFSCLEYDELVKRFELIVCSRYHGIVHAYRNQIPCILLGWAVKYHELAELLGQEEYSFDITDDKLDIKEVLKAVRKICREYVKESKVIHTRLEFIQKDNCFDIVFGEESNE